MSKPQELAERLNTQLDRTDLRISLRNAFIAAFVFSNRETLLSGLAALEENKKLKERISVLKERCDRLRR